MITEGTEAIIKVSAEGGKCADDIALTVNGVKLIRSELSLSYAKFRFPGTIPQGTYDLNIKNNGLDYVAGKITVVEDPAKNRDIVIKPTFDKSSITEQVSDTIKVSGTDGIEYGEIFVVLINDVPATLSDKSYSYFKFETGQLAVGNYPVKVKNAVKEQSIGTITVVKAAPPIEPVFTKYSGDLYGSNVLVKNSFKNFDAAPDFAVLANGDQCKIYEKRATYFKFYTPKGLSKGTRCDIVVFNNGIKYPAGWIIIK